MKLTELNIRPDRNWAPVSADNPLRAVVKLNNEKSAVECVLSESTMRRMLDLCAEEIAANAERNMRDFVEAVSALDTEKSRALLK